MAGNWYVHVGGSTSGPHPGDHVRHWLANGQLPANALFWTEGATEWVTAKDARPKLGLPEHSAVAAPAQQPSASASAPSPAAAVQRRGPVETPTPTQGVVRPTRPAAARDEPAVVDLRNPAAASVRRSRRDLLGDAHTGQIQHAALNSRSALHTMTDRLADFAGVEPISGFRLSELLSLATKNHSRDEVEEYFATGLPGLTPPLSEVESNWPKPWMFVRLYVGASLFFLGFLAMYKIFNNSNLLPGMILVGSFMVPVTIVVFFFETNTPRNVSLYMVGRAFFAGGILSLAITLVLVQIGVANMPFISQLSQPEHGWSAAIITGVVEEIGKLLAIFVIAMGMSGQRYPWILNGMLIGSAVGAGFAAFESSGYALNVLLETRNVDAAVNVILLRGALAPFGHVLWAALAGGALWRVKRDRKVSLSMLVDHRVLRVLLFTITMHALWNSPIYLPFKLKYVLLGVFGWVLVLGMITAGLRQIKATQAAAEDGGSALPQPTGLQPVVPPVGRH